MTARGFGVLAGALLLAAVAPRGAAAQGTFTLELSNGTPVRVETADAPGEHRVGRVVDSTPDSLTVRFPRIEQPLAYPVGDLRTVEIRGGDDRGLGARRGAIVGLIIAAVGGGIDLVGGHTSLEDLGGIAVSNALLCALIGYAFPPRGWERLPLPR